jgi:hypothetical protein
VITLRSIGPVLAALTRRPGLWPEALRSARSLVPDRWWRRAPFLPLPDRRWLHFRLVTAYGGDGSGPILADDLVTWLEWRRHFPTA